MNLEAKLDLLSYFAPADRAHWEDRFRTALDGTDPGDMRWGPNGGPTIEPYPEHANAVALSASAGFEIATLSHSAHPEVSAEADLAIVRMPLDGASSSLEDSAFYWADQPFPAVPSGRLLFDPAAAVLRGGSSRAEGSGTAIDLAAWDEAGAHTTQLCAAAFAAFQESHETGSGRIDGVLVPLGTEFFPAVALLRAIRAGLERLSGTAGHGARAPRLIAFCAPSALQSTDTDSNLLRLTTTAAAAAIGGADVIALPSMDGVAEADGPKTFGPGSPRGLRLARNLGLLLKHEGHLDKVADSAAGSVYVETLTQAIGQAAWSQLQDWESEGGLHAVLEEGTLLETLEKQRTARAQAVDSGEQVRVGVNRFQGAST